MSATTMTRISRELLEELRKEKEETRIPIIALLEKAWEEYKKSKEEK